MNVFLATAWEAVEVPRRAAALLWRYLPQLLTVIFLALAARAAMLWLAVLVSEFSPLAATLLFPFAPLAVMAGLIVCLWIMQPSMHFFTGKDSFTRLDKVTLLTVGGLLVPFLTVYSSHGLLKDDARAFVYDTVTIEVANSLVDYNFGRSLIDQGWLIFAFIASIIVLRKLIGVFKLGERAFGVATAAAYLEVLWMATASTSVTSNYLAIKEWMLTRQGIGPMWEAVTSAKDWMVTHTWILGDFVDWVWSNALQIANFIVIPFAWLTLGAVVYNTSLTKEKEEPTEPAQPEPEPASARPLSTSRRYQQVAVRTTRRMLDDATQPIAGPFKNAWRNFKTLALAGAVPMLTFCLVFVLASGAELGAIYVIRAMLKPLALDTITVGLEPYMLVIARAVYFLVALPLVVAALDRFLGAAHATPSEEPTPEATS